MLFFLRSYTHNTFWVALLTFYYTSNIFGRHSATFMLQLFKCLVFRKAITFYILLIYTSMLKLVENGFLSPKTTVISFARIAS
jgi:hypothetical protein